MRMLAFSMIGADGLRRHEGRGSHQQDQLRQRCQAGNTHTLAHAYTPVIAGCLAPSRMRSCRTHAVGGREPGVTHVRKWMCILLVGVFVVTASTATFALTSQRPWQGAWPLDTTEARAYVSVTTNQTPRKPQTPETPAQDHFATSKSKSESTSDADMLSGIEAKEQELCAREDKELKSMDPDGRCGWYMAAELLYGTTRQWADAKKLLVDIAAGDFKLFLELRTMKDEERLDYCNALRSNGADANQYFDLTMLRALAWCMGIPVKVLSVDPAYDGDVYGTEYALALREAAGQAVPAPVCVVCACLSRCGQRLADLGQFCCLHRAASHSG